MPDKRCAWAEGSDLMREYHDTEWGVPSHDDNYLFEMLLLEGAQAGLSWSTVLNKRENYRAALNDFDIAKCSRYSDAKLAKLLENPGIIRNRLKIQSVVINAKAFIAVQKEFGSFDEYLWGFVGNTPVVTRRKAGETLPARNELSDHISKDLKKRGFKFIGSTIIYAYLQAVGVVDDHIKGCQFA